MSNNIRISKVIREFNISLESIVDFLSSKGHEIFDARPTSRITEEHWLLISKEFSTDRRDKSLSKKLTADDIQNLYKSSGKKLLDKSSGKINLLRTGKTIIAKTISKQSQRLSFKSNIISRPKNNLGLKTSYSSSIDQTTLSKLNALKTLMIEREIKIVKENQDRERRKKDEQKQKIANEIKKTKLEKQKRKKEETENKIKSVEQTKFFQMLFKNKKPIEFFPNLSKKYSKLKASYYLLHYTHENMRYGGYQTEIKNNHKKLISEFEENDFKDEFKVNAKTNLGPEITDYMNLNDIIKNIEQKNENLLKVLENYNKLLFKFKDGNYPYFFASIFISCFGKNFFYDKIIIPISASTSEKTETRFGEFINYICIICGAINGMDIFKTENRDPKHKGGTSKTSFLNSYKKNQIRNKKIILIDDMFTRGVQSDIWLDEINKFSPSQIECVYLAKGLERKKDFKNNEKVRILNPIYADSNNLFVWYLDDKNKSFSLRNRYDISDGQIVEISDTTNFANKFWIRVRFEDPDPSVQISDNQCRQTGVSKAKYIIIPKHFVVKIESVYSTGKFSETINNWPNFVEDSI